MFGLSTLGYIGWGLFFFAFVLILREHSRHINIRMSLNAFIKWILLDDNARSFHAEKFIELLKNEKFKDDRELFLASDRYVETLATILKREGAILKVEGLMMEYSDKEISIK